MKDMDDMEVGCAAFRRMGAFAKSFVVHTLEEKSAENICTNTASSCRSSSGTSTAKQPRPGC